MPCRYPCGTHRNMSAGLNDKHKDQSKWSSIYRKRHCPWWGPEIVSFKETNTNTKEGPMSTSVQSKTRVWNSGQSRLERPGKERRSQKAAHATLLAMHACV